MEQKNMLLLRMLLSPPSNRFSILILLKCNLNASNYWKLNSFHIHPASSSYFSSLSTLASVILISQKSEEEEYLLDIFPEFLFKRLCFLQCRILLASCCLHNLLPVPHRRYCYYYSSQYYITKYNVKGLLDSRSTIVILFAIIDKSHIKGRSLCYSVGTSPTLEISPLWT